MNTRTPSQANQLNRLEKMREAFEKLRAEQIRAEGEVERLARELELARKSARAEFGTDDEAALERLVEETEARNAQLVDEFAARLLEIEDRLRELGSH